METDNHKKALTAAKSTQTQPRTQIEELRELLTTIEKRLARLKEISPSDTLGILPMLDQAQKRLDSQAASGTSGSSEGAQFESLLMQFDKKSQIFMNRAGGPAALQKARQERQPQEGQWWWFIDESMAQKRQLKIKRWSVGAGLVGVLLVIVVLVYKQFLAPDPVFQAGIGYQQTAENYFIQGRYEEALADVNEAIERLPEYPELFVLRGVIYEMLEQPNLAEESYELAREVLSKEENFYTLRTKYYLMAVLADKAIADAEMALSLNPDLAITLLFLGQAYELKGDISTAIDYYEAASEVAERTEEIQVQVFARMNLAQALQAIVPPATATPVK